MTKPFRIASQLGPDFDAMIRIARPDVDVLAIGQGVPSEMPDDVQALVALPMRQSGREAPLRPAGWPFSLDWVQLVSVGTDLYPDWIFEGPTVSCARGATSTALAEFALSAIFAAAKKLPETWISGPEGWTRRRVDMVRGSTLGILGFGGIGTALAPVAQALGMRVIASRRTEMPFEVPGVERVANIEELFANSDHLVLAAPATAQTAGIVSAAVLACARPGLHIINIARGILIDDDALLDALDSGKISRATLDVTHPEPLPTGHPFYTHPRIFLSPHIAVMTGEVGMALRDKLLENLDRVMAGQPPLDIVDPQRGY